MAESKPSRAPILPQLTTRAIARFWSKVTKTDGCWEWNGLCGQQGYGRFTLGGKTLRAHRIAVVIAGGQEIPDGLFVCHHCDNPRCVRPDHLFLGTNADNLRDCKHKGRNATGDRNGSRRHPQKLNPPKGDRSGFRKHPEIVPRGEAQWRSRLTDRDIILIRELASQGISQCAIAAAFDYDQPNISAIVRRKKWAHVKPLSDDGKIVVTEPTACQD